VNHRWPAGSNTTHAHCPRGRRGSSRRPPAG
jgi:hypothetical protein